MTFEEFEQMVEYDVEHVDKPYGTFVTATFGPCHSKVRTSGFIDEGEVRRLAAFKLYDFVRDDYAYLLDTHGQWPKDCDA